MSDFYTYKCWKCGKEIEIESEPKSRVFCEECFELYRNDYKNIVSDYVKLKIFIMYETALRIMEKAGMYMYEYQNAANEVLTEAQADNESYYSSDEMVAAIVLKEFGYDYIPNYAVGNYRVDFYIPELCVCFEVDGYMHKHSEVRDSERDTEIRNTLGKEWEIVRIPTKYIEKDPSTIPEAIEIMANEKRKIRRENGGILPESYSGRERKHYDKIGEHRTQRIKVL